MQLGAAAMGKMQIRAQFVLYGFKMDRERQKLLEVSITRSLKMQLPRAQCNIGSSDLAMVRFSGRIRSKWAFGEFVNFRSRLF